MYKLSDFINFLLFFFIILFPPRLGWENQYVWNYLSFIY